MKVVVLCEGKTEAALRTALHQWVNRRLLETNMGIAIKALGGSLLRSKFRTQVERNLADPAVLAVIGLTDVYPNFDSAMHAKAALTTRVAGSADSKSFRPHVALFEVEAWLLPFWDDIATRLGVQAKRPGDKPEDVNTQKPPSKHIEGLFRRAGKEYQKARDAPKWLTADRLEIAAQSCPELKAFLNTLLELAGAEPLP